MANQIESENEAKRVSLDAGANVKILLNDVEKVNITVPSWALSAEFTYRYNASRGE